MGRKNVKEIDDMTWSEVRAAVKRKGHKGSWVSTCSLPVLRDLLSGDITEEQARASESMRTLEVASKATNLLDNLCRETAVFRTTNNGVVPLSLGTTDLNVLRKALWDAVRLLDDARRERDTEHQQNWKKGAENIERISQLEREKSTLIGAFKLVLASK